MLAALLLAPLSLAASRPSLVHIVIDDLGSHDLGYKDTESISPSIDARRAEGVELGRFFSAKWRAPARSPMHADWYEHMAGRRIVLVTPRTTTAGLARGVGHSRVWWLTKGAP